MTHNSKTRRRWFGAVCLLVAITLVVAEATVLKNRLGNVAALVYWLGCFVCTALAICAAFLDLRELGREAREEQRALFEKTLEQIRRDKTARGQDVADKPNRTD